MVILISAVHPSQGYFAAAMATAGSFAGNLLLFYIGRKGGEAYLERHTLHARGRRLRASFIEYGLLTILGPGLVIVPLPLKVFVLSAGALGVSPMRLCMVLLGARLAALFFWPGSGRGSEKIPSLTWSITRGNSGCLPCCFLLRCIWPFVILHRRKQHLFTDLT